MQKGDEPHILPDNWKWVRFGEIFDYRGGGQPPKSEFVDEPREGYVRLYQIRDLGDNPVPVYVPKESVTKYMTDSDILIGRYGASVGKIFRGENGTYNVALIKLVFTKDLVSTDYVYHLLHTNYFQKPVTEISRSAQAGFNKSNLFPLPLPLPPREGQKRIVETVDRLMEICDALEAQLKKAESTGAELFDAMLHHVDDEEEAVTVG